MALYDLQKQLRALQNRIERAKRGTPKMAALRAQLAEVERQIREVGKCVSA